MHPINLVINVVIGVLILSCFVFLLFWMFFLLNRILHHYSCYKKETSKRNYSPLEFDIDVFNNKVKCIIYTFLLLLIITEVFCMLTYIGSIMVLNHASFNVTVSSFPMDIELNCSTNSYGIWQYEIGHPFFALFICIGDMSLYLICILMVALLKFIFIAYQCKTNFKSVKIFLIKSSLILQILLTISVIPQTQILSKILTPLFGMFLINLLFKHKKVSFSFLNGDVMTRSFSEIAKLTFITH